MPPQDGGWLTGMQHRTPSRYKTKEDCWPCRLISGFGLLASGGYVLYNVEKAKSRLASGVMLVTASVLLTLGAARLLDTPPFGDGAYGYAPPPPRAITPPTNESEVNKDE